MKLDPITTEVVISRIRETTAAMAHALFHSGYSPILRESQDGTAGLCDAEGRVIMVGGGLQYHSLLYTRAVESVCARYPLPRCAMATASSPTIPTRPATRTCPTSW